MAPEGVSLHLLHGLLDEAVSYRHVVDAAQAWVELGADVTADVLPGVGHELAAPAHRTRHPPAAHLHSGAALARSGGDRGRDGEGGTARR